MNTKKDYDRAASIVRDIRSNPHKSKKAYLEVEDAFVAFFASDNNPRFNADRFRKACEVEK